MKTAKSIFLPALLICLFGLTIGCEQSVTIDPAVVETPSGDEAQQQAKSDPVIDSAADNGDVLTVPNNDVESLAIAGKPTAQAASSVQTEDSTDVAPNANANEHEFDNEDEPEQPAEPTIDIPAHWKRLSQTQEIWVDHKNKQVIVGGKICLDAGPLEMLICPRGTKEHESIVSVNSQSWQVHAALIAVGATPGVPCRWVPEYTPAWGPKIEIQLMWRDEKTNKVKTADGKQWILNSETEKPMTTELVFGGSYHEPQIEGDRPRYMADAGELICLDNFSTSTIDVRTLDKDTQLYFEANTPLIPPINTQIYTVIKPGAVVGKP